MKKSFIAVAALFAAVAFTACSGSSEKANADTDTVAVVEETVVVTETTDSCACPADSCAQDSCATDTCSAPCAKKA